MSAAIVPCKRPRVTVDPRDVATDGVLAACHVPGCGWAYPQDLKRYAVKSDADWQAIQHRKDHRAAVPSHRVTSDGGPGFVADCKCGWRWAYRGTRADAQQILDHHLSSVHGLVTCS